MPLPVRAAFAYKKKKDRREYVRVALRRGADGEVEAVKHPQDGAGDSHFADGDRRPCSNSPRTSRASSPAPASGFCRMRR